MSHVNGMMPGPDLGSKPSGNSNSLVSEISSRGVVGSGPMSTMHGKPATIKMSTSNKNNCTTNLKGTGPS